MFEQKIVEILTALQKLVEKHGPDALALALRVIRIEAVFDVASSTALLVAVAIGVKFFRRWWSKHLDDVNNEAEFIGRWIASLAFGIVAAVGIINFMVVWFSARMWMALFDPRLALAYDILKRVEKVVK